MHVNGYSVGILISDIEHILDLIPKVSCSLLISFHPDILKIFEKITV